MNFQEVLSILSAKEEISIVSDIKLDEPVTFTVHYETPEDLLIYLSSLAGGDYVREGNLYKIIKKIENLQVIKTSLPDDRLRDVFPEIKRFNNYLISRTEYDLKSDIEKLEKF